MALPIDRTVLGKAGFDFPGFRSTFRLMTHSNPEPGPCLLYETIKLSVDQSILKITHRRASARVVKSSCLSNERVSGILIWQ